MFNLDDLIDNIEGDPDFEEIPVDIDTFMGKGYLEQTGVVLSHHQKDMVEHITQIFRYDTLVRIYGEAEANRLRVRTVREVISMLGKACHAPYTPTYNPQTGRWQRLDEFTATAGGTAAGWMANGKFESTYVTESFLEGYGEMVRVTTQSGIVEDVSLSHKYLAAKKNTFYKRRKGAFNPEYIEVRHLQPGDRIALSLEYPTDNEVSIGEDEAWVLGMLIGDGCMPGTYVSGRSTTVSIDFHVDEEESIGRFISIISSRGDEVSTRVDYENKKMVTLKFSRTRAPWLFSVIDAHDLHDKNVYTKSVPDAIWTAPVNEVAAFVGGLFMSDGSVYWKKNGGKTLQPMIEFSSSSEAGLSQDVQKLLWKIGVPAKIRTKYPRYTYKGEVKSGKPAYVIDLGGADRVLAFHASVSLFDKKQRVLEEFADHYNKKNKYQRIEGGMYYDMISSIEPIGYGEYWTMTQPETHNYVGNGLVSHQSGKDYISEIACAYVVYKLLCLKDPAVYFGKPPGDSIDIINVAINADQAQNVFFKGLSRIIKGSPWFENKFLPKQRQISFDKNVTVYSGHSEAEAFEGYNILIAILDEIAGFEHFTPGSDESGKSPAQAIYDMYNASVSSRFAKNGKVVLLSFPRQKGDFISSRYDEVVAEKISHPMEHTFVLNPDLPEDTPGNSFSIEWSIDEIVSYRKANVWALRRPTWDVNPTKHIDDFTDDFFSEPNKALGKFAAEPQESVGGFFGEHDKIDMFSNYKNGIDDNNVFYESFKPKADIDYFIHVDLAQKHDRCVVSMAHVSRWKHSGRTDVSEEFIPEVIVDLIRYWTPGRDKQVDFAEVREFIMSIIRRGFPVKKITFDQWRSEEMIKYFNRLGIESDILSVGLPHYTDLKLIISEKRGLAPKNEILRRELKQLFITKNGKNVDHPRTKEGSKDIADSVCGAVYNAVTLTPRAESFTFQVLSEDDAHRTPIDNSPVEFLDNVPRRQAPDDIARFIGLI